MTNRVIESPCINVCTLDPGTQVCIGCYRTIDEIATWTSFSDEERLAILEGLPARKTKYQFTEQMAATGSGQTQRCDHCGAQFNCGAQGQQPCWCASFPHVTPPISAGGGCLCPTCLADAVRGGQ